MRKYGYLIYDVLCIGVALVVALYLRHGIPLIQEGTPQDLTLLLLVTAVTALLIFPLMRIHISIWRYTSSAEVINIMIAVALVILVTNSGLFLISRLHMMPRSVPPMQWALAVIAMAGSRVMVRQLLGPPRAFAKHQSALKQHVIVVGACHTAELYLRFIKRVMPHQVVVEGIVDSNPALTNRVFQKHKILGTPEQLPELIERFRVHGIHIRHVVLAQMLRDLSRSERNLLREMKQAGAVGLVHFAKQIAPQSPAGHASDEDDFYQNTLMAGAGEYITPKGYYPRLKRVVDVVLGVLLILALLPLMAIVALLVWLDVGFPLIFWQQRPGLYGKPFRLYKFRTMRPAGRKQDEDRLAHKSGDTMRTSAVGKLIRRLRWDELPQLFHIIAGTMSFVGPRPLLPEDQPVGGQIRLSVRPGVTGWAQVNGGDALSPAEKLLLDAWYIRHMSWWLDIRILLRTLIVVFTPDAPVQEVIDRAKQSLREESIAHEQL